MSATEPLDGNFYGKFVMTDQSAGTYEFQLNNSATCVQALDDGKNLSVTASVAVIDPQGAYSTKAVSLTIKGSNDAPTLTGAESGAVKESGVYADGALKPSDHGYTLTTDENKATTAVTANAAAVGDQHQLSVTGVISGADVDGTDKLNFGFSLNGPGAASVPGGNSALVTDLYVVKDDAATDGYRLVAGSSATAADKADAYGHLTMNNAADKSGTYTFTVNNAANGPSNALGENQHVSFTITPTVTDGSVLVTGDSGKSFTITVNGTNDQPTITSASWTGGVNSVTEQGAVDPTASSVISGTVVGHDSDSNDQHHLTYGFAAGSELVKTMYVVPNGNSYTLSATAPADGNYYGTFVMTDQSAGTYEFQLNNSATCVQALDDGNNLSVTARVAVIDPQGAYSTKTVNLTINGSNDAPTLTGVVGGAVKESGVYADGVLKPSDHGYSLVGGENTPTSEAANAAAVGDHHQLTVTGVVSGADVDTPDTQLDFGFSLSGPGASVAAGGKSALATDVYVIKDGSSQGYHLEAVPAGTPANAAMPADSYGRLTMNNAADKSGTYTFTLNNDGNGPANALGENQSKGLVIAPTVTDGTAISTADSSHTFTITVNGTNDQPTITSTTWTGESSVTEQGFVNPAASSVISGTVVGHDSDSNDQGHLTYGFAAGSELVATMYVVPNGNSYTLSATAPADANFYGKFVMTDQGAGTYEFQLNNNATCVQQMDDGDSIPISANVVVADKQGAYSTKTVNLTINGSNDAPTLTGADSTGVKESGVYRDGLRSGNDANGYTLNPLEHAGLPADTDKTVDSAHSLLINTGTITGADVDGSDKLDFGFSLNGASTGTPSVVGGALVTDVFVVKDDTAANGYRLVDAGKASDTDKANAYGELSMDNAADKSGTYTFKLNDSATSPVNALSEGEIKEITIAPTVSDGTVLTTASDAQTFKITLTGSNERPTLTGVNWGAGGNALTERVDASTTPVNSISGTVAGTDVDVNDVSSLKYGFVYTATNGSQTLVANLYAVSDGKGSYTLTTSAPTDGNYYGTFSMTDMSKGTYTFTLNNSATCVQQLTDSDPLYSIAAPAAVIDRFGAWSDTTNVSLTIKGANDSPYQLTNNTGAKVRDDGVYAANTYGNTPATFVNAHENDAISPLSLGTGAGQQLKVVTGKLVAKDYEDDSHGKAGSMQYSCTGGIAVGHQNSSGGQNEVKLPDGTVLAPHAGPGGYDVTYATNNYGTLYVKSDGTYYFVLDQGSATVNALGEGQSATTTFNISVADSNGKSTNFASTKGLAITVYGGNDAPDKILVNGNDIADTTNGAANGTILMGTEDKHVHTATGSLAVHDVDTVDMTKGHDIMVQSVSTNDAKIELAASTSDNTMTINGKYGTLTITRNEGSNSNTHADDTYDYKYVLNPDAAKVLGAGETGNDVFNVTLRDQYGATITKPLTFSTNGADDPTVINPKWLTPIQNVIEAGVTPADSADAAVNAKNYNNTSAGEPTTTGYIGASDIDGTDQASLNGGSSAPNLHFGITVGSNTVDIYRMMTETTYTASGASKNADGSVTITLAHGTLTITKYTGSMTDASGNKPLYQYDYTLNNDDPAVNKLNSHDRATDPFTVTVLEASDGTVAAGVTPTVVSITIEGTNDKPIISLAPALSTTENSADVLTGRVEVTDYEQTHGQEKVDSGFTFSLVTAKNLASTDITKQYDLASDDGVMQGKYGTLKLDQLTGSYSYTRNTEDLNYLNNGESVTDTFYVRVKDANGAYSDIKPIVVTINGQDDGGRVSTSTGGVHLVEDGVAAGDEAQHGIFHYTQDGYLGYNNPVSIDLNTKLEGKVLVSDSDSSDAHNYKTFSYTVAGGSNASVVDNGNGTYTIYDGADHSAGHSYGTLTLNSDGTYSFTPTTVTVGGVTRLADNINSLAEGESVTVTVNVTANSAAGAAENATGSFNVVISGTNDAPVVAVNSHIDEVLNAHGNSGNEHKVSVSGDVAASHLATDADNNAALKYFIVDDKNPNDGYVEGSIVQHFEGQYGTLLLNPNGSYMYVLNGDSSTLNNQEEHFTIYVRDEHNAVALNPISLTITIKDNPQGGGNGGNSGHALSLAAATNSVQEDLAGHDEAKGDIAPTGSWDSGLKLTGTYSENGAPGSMSADDAGRTVVTSYGTLALLPDGSYTYLLDNYSPDVQQLASGQTITQVFNVTGSDSTSTTITIHIQGTNDTPYVVQQASALAVHQYAGQTEWVSTASTAPTGSFIVSDVDNNEGKALTLSGATSIDPATNDNYSYKVAGDHGIFYIKAGEGIDNNGVPCTKFEYKYVATDKGNFRGAVTDTAHVGVTDGHETITIDLSTNLTADNDTTQAPSAPTLSVTEDVTLEVSATASVSGKDTYLGGNAETITYKLVDGSGDDLGLMAKGAYGTLMLDATTGKYTYVLNTSNAAVQALGVQDTALGETFHIVASDGSNSSAASDIKVVINGTNDKPTLSLYGANGTGVAGSGANLYVADGSSDMVVSGKAVTFDADANDRSGLVLSLDGSSSTLTKDIYAFKNGNNWETCDSSHTGAQKMGSFVLGTDGKYTFTGNQTGISHLGQGEKLVIESMIGVSDTHGATDSGKVTVTITGTNDAPVLNGVSAQTITDNGTSTQGFTCSFDSSDAEGDATSYFIKTADGRYVTSMHDGHGTLQINSNNTYTYTLDASYADAVKALAQDAPDVGGTFTLVAVDSHGLASAGKDLVVTLKGVNDAPTFSITPSVTSVTEDSTAKASGTFALADVDSDGSSQHIYITSTDTNATVTQEFNIATKTGAASITSHYGTLTMNANGTYSYELNNNSASVQALKAGESYTDKFTVYSEDSHGKASGSQTISVTISGVNDTPVVSISAPSDTLAEDGAKQTVSGTFSVADSDHDGNLQTLTITSTGNSSSASQAMDLSAGSGTASVSSNYGKLTLNGDGTYSYELNNSSASVQGLKANESYTDQFTVVAKDSTGLNSISKTINVVINGTNDAPVVASVAHDVVEGAAAQLVALAVTDADHDALTYAISYGAGSAVSADSGAAAVVAGSYGSLTMDATGHYSYAMDSHALAAGQHATEVFHVTVNDGQGGTTTRDITFNLTGVNDVPVAHAGSFTTMSGQLVATDADAGETASLHYTAVSDATFGHVTVDANGTYHYDLNIHSEQGVDLINHELTATGWQANSTLHDGFLFTASDDAHTTSNPAGVDLYISGTVTDAFGGHAVEIGTGASAIHLVFGSSANDGIDLSTSNPTESHVLYGGGGDDTLYGGNGGDYLFGGANNDHLQGGAGVDHLYGGANDDFLDGKGSASGDFLDGGEGNDLLVFNHNDTVDGGTGINVLLVKDAASDVDSLFADHGHVKNIAVMLTGAAASLTDARELHDNLGITLDNTNTSVTLDSSKWTAVSGSNYSWSNNTDGSVLTVADGSHSSVDDEAAKIVIQLQNHQG
ncbi:beta strand repeat-containing protein [Desulfovibrio sp.]|uniref:beta strand repeat-containing protein n=1 Tax=Desulfovibrio sp. TaxID=885 RepID=UPI0035B46D3B